MHISRKKYLLRLGVIMALPYALYLVCNKFSHKERYVQALEARADAERYIVLAMTDEGFADMAINFHEASLQAHHIDNFLFVGVGRKTCEILKNIPCFYYTDDPNEGKASSYGQRDYVRKMNIRTDMILEALAANFTVIHTDTDIAFLSNPLPEIKVAVQNADIAILWDARVFNAGFLVVKPSPLGQQLYQLVRELTKRSRIDDQKALNMAIEMLMKQNQDELALRVNVLDRNRFLSGFYYFMKYGQKLPKLCDGGKPSRKSVCPLVVHNNWIIGKEAKIYRFREHLMWKYDGDDQYYSSETRRYLTYTNPKPTTAAARKNMIERQISALKTALAIGHLINRVVILPTFHCGRSAAFWPCSLNSVLVDIKTFEDCFSGRYRESSFLRHPKVPDSVKQDVTNRKFSLKQLSDVLASGADIMHLFSEISAKVLTITNLQQIKIAINDGFFDNEFINKTQTAFRSSPRRKAPRQLR